MAVTETRQLVNPTLEGSLTAFLKKLDPLGGQAINTASYARSLDPIGINPPPL